MKNTIEQLKLIMTFFLALTGSNIPMSQKRLFRDCDTIADIHAVIVPLLEAEYSKELDWLYSLTRPATIELPFNFYVICEN